MSSKASSYKYGSKTPTRMSQKKKANRRMNTHQHSKSSLNRRKQRELSKKYKQHALRQIIEKITTKSMIISTNIAKDKLISFYPAFTTSQELIAELEHRFFSVLPIVEEDKSAHPYISDTESVSEQHFKFRNDRIDKDKAYCIQIRIINLLMFWMKEYFMDDFIEAKNIDILRQFIEKIKKLKTKTKLPSIPMSDVPFSDIPPIPSIDEKENDFYSDIVKKNKSNFVIINTAKYNQNTDDVIIRNELRLDINDDANSE